MLLPWWWWSFTSVIYLRADRTAGLKANYKISPKTRNIYAYVRTCVSCALAQFVHALQCKLVCRGFYFQWGHWDISLT
jgi:hypothetical protein